MPTGKNISEFLPPDDRSPLKIKYLLAFSTFLSVILPFGVLAKFSPNEEKDSVSSTQQSIIFISDTQAPMWFEKIFVKTHRNEEATKILFNAIVSDATVSSVFFLGDVTAMGSFDHNWTTIDSFLTHLKVKHIPAYATPGNHDYLLFPSTGEDNFRKRFPSFNRIGYTVRTSYVCHSIVKFKF